MGQIPGENLFIAPFQMPAMNFPSQCKLPYLNCLGHIYESDDKLVLFSTFILFSSARALLLSRQRKWCIMHAKEKQGAIYIAHQHDQGQETYFSAWRGT